MNSVNSSGFTSLPIKIVRPRAMIVAFLSLPSPARCLFSAGYGVGGTWRCSLPLGSATSRGLAAGGDGSRHNGSQQCTNDEQTRCGHTHLQGDNWGSALPEIYTTAHAQVQWHFLSLSRPGIPKSGMYVFPLSRALEYDILG